MFSLSSSPDTSFCIYSTFPFSVVVVADVKICPIPCVYSYVLFVYVLPEFNISRGDTYTNWSFPFILYFAIFAVLYE